MTQTELEQENERLEGLLQRGELPLKESRRLEKVREALVQLELVKDEKTFLI